MHGRLIPIGFSIALLSLPVLAWVQYRWVDRVSESELQRETRRLTESLGNVETHFDAEITRAEMWFAPGPPDEDEEAVDLFQQTGNRLRRWFAQTEFPNIVAAVLIKDEQGRTVRALPDGRTEPASMPEIPDLPGPIVSIDGFYGLQAGRGRGGPHPRFNPDRRPPAFPDDPENGERRRAVLVLLNREVLQNEVLPALISRYMGQGTYDTELRAGATVLSRTRLAAGAPDASVGLFAVRPDCLFGREEHGGERGRPRFGGPRGGFPRHGPPRGEFRGNLLRRASGVATCEPLQAGAPEAEWTLSAWHPAGSLATAVAGFRTRNL